MSTPRFSSKELTLDLVFTGETHGNDGQYIWTFRTKDPSVTLENRNILEVSFISTDTQRKLGLYADPLSVKATFTLDDRSTVQHDGLLSNQKDGDES